MAQPILQEQARPGKTWVECLTEQYEMDCLQCGARIMGFYGHYHCDSCIAKWEAVQWNQAIREHLEELVRRGDINKATLRCSFKHSTRKREPLCYKKARTWDPTSGWSAYIYGPPGSGRTYLARCLLNQVVGAYFKSWDQAHKPTIIETTGNRFVDLVRAFDVDLQRLVLAQGLFVDDIDAAPWNERSISYFRELLGRRAEGNRPTFVTAQFEPPKMVELLDKYCQKNAVLASSCIRKLEPMLELSLGAQSQQGPAQAVEDEEDLF